MATKIKEEKFKGSKPWLVFWIIIFFPIAIGYYLSKTKKENWFYRYPILTTIGICFIIFTLASIFESSTYSDLTNGEDAVIKLITKSPENMLPSPSELPTEYSIGEKEDVPKNSTLITSRNAQEGFDSGRQLSISKYNMGMYSVSDYIEITFGIYKFDNSDSAYNFQNNIAQSVVSGGGYEKVSVSANAECFAWKEDYGYDTKLGSNICYNKNVVYWIDVSMANTFKKPDGVLKEMTKIIDKKVG